MLALSRRHGLPKPLVNPTVSGYEVDFLWSSERLVVETLKRLLQPEASISSTR